MLVYGKYECFVMQMFVSCVHPVAVLHDLQFVNAGQDARDDHMEEAYSRAGLHDCIICSHESCAKDVLLFAFRDELGFLN